MKRLNFSVILLSLVAGLLSPLQAEALTPFLQREATAWGHTYAGTANVISQVSNPKTANAEAKSKFLVNYRNFPEWAKKDLQAAVDVWAANFQSDVSITIDAAWMRLSNSGILGSARPGSYFAGFDGAPDASLWYPSALANALAKKDLDQSQAEMVIQVNSLADWNTTNDGVSHFNQYDLQSVFIHEIGHGLGFLSTDSYDPYFGYGTIDQPTPFDAYAVTSDGIKLSDFPSPSKELGNALTSKLLWSGPLGIAANNNVKPVLYTPSRYEDGSSISHLDEATFSKSVSDAVMTPELNAGEIFRSPGPLLLAMMEDMRNKPPASPAVGLPEPVRNASALISDSSALISFDPPINVRTAQVSSYTVRNLRNNQVFSSTTSPIKVTGLKNGVSYSFSVIASNSNGSSIPVTTNNVTPQDGWKFSLIEDGVSVTSLVDVTFNEKPVLLYINQNSGSLKLATYSGTKWVKTSVDGRTVGNRTGSIKGALSACVSGTSPKQTLNIFYSDVAESDLHLAQFDGKKFKYETVDGDAATENKYEDPVRVRTSSDVSVTSACVATTEALQVFYRDESQGIVLGAIKKAKSSNWVYELLDGDRKTDGRTTGDVAFHLSALQDGKTTYVLYDSVLTINQKKEATSGEIRVAQRVGISPAAWEYDTIEATTPQNPVIGFDVELAKGPKGVFATWLSASNTSLPKATRVRWSYLNKFTKTTFFGVDTYGTPSKYLSTNGSMIAYNCQERLCAIDVTKSAPIVSLVSGKENPDGISSTWISIKKVKYLVAGLDDQLVMLRPKN